MITSMHIENFKCFKRFDINLGPFNVLVGPNDSGKTAFLQAIMIAGADGPNSKWDLGNLNAKAGLVPGTANVWRGDTSRMVSVQAYGGPWERPGNDRRSMDVTSPNGSDFTSHVRVQPDAPPVPPERSENPKGAWLEDWMREAIGSISYYALDPGDLRQPTNPSTDTYRMSRTGLGLPTFLEDILTRDRETFFALEKAFYARFPEYERIVIEKEDVAGRVGYAISLRTRHGDTLPAGSVSDGVMLSLAYVALCYQPEPPKILLIEEPETGVHYGSLKEIVGMLKHLSSEKHVQVILTTHSPYLLDCVEPEEVRVFAKDQDGAAHAAKLSDHPDVTELKKYLMTGEIWTEFDEAEIVSGKGAASE